MQTQARNATLEELRDLLVEQHARKLDIVAPAAKLLAENGDWVVSGVDPVIDESGVTVADGKYRPTEVFDEGVSQKLGIPIAYLRKIRDARPDLYDANVNGWLRGRRGKTRIRDGQLEVLQEPVAGDSRSFLLRAFRADDSDTGIARALLSDQYAIMDNLDALVAALDGVAQAGVAVNIVGADLTDRRMYVRVVADEVKILAPELLAGYRSPFSGETGADNPTMFAGFVISNSETGDGAFSIVPRLVVQVCSNGLTITKDALRAVHLGGRMEESVIRWSDDTQRKDLALVTARARDAVSTFLDVDYMLRVVREINEKAGRPFTNVEDGLKVIGKKLQFDQETQNSVFAMFVKGGDMTAGGVMHAVTAAARQTGNADLAAEMEGSALKALELAAALA